MRLLHGGRQAGHRVDDGHGDEPVLFALDGAQLPAGVVVVGQALAVGVDHRLQPAEAVVLPLRRPRELRLVSRRRPGVQLHRRLLVDEVAGGVVRVELDLRAVLGLHDLAGAVAGRAHAAVGVRDIVGRARVVDLGEPVQVVLVADLLAGGPQIRGDLAGLLAVGVVGEGHAPAVGRRRRGALAHEVVRVSGLEARRVGHLEQLAHAVALVERGTRCRANRRGVERRHPGGVVVDRPHDVTHVGEGHRLSAVRRGLRGHVQLGSGVADLAVLVGDGRHPVTGFCDLVGQVPEVVHRLGVRVVHRVHR